MPSRRTKRTPEPADVADASQSEVNPGLSAEAEPATAEVEVDFFERLRGFTVEDWQTGGYKTYVYRTWPVIDRRDSEHFLAKISEAFDEDYLLRYFGTGKYNLRLNNQQGRTIAQKTVSLHNPDFPPKVSPDEVVRSDPRNERYFQVYGPKEVDATPKTATESLRGSSRANGTEISDAAVKLAIAQSQGRDELARELANRSAVPAADPVGAVDKVLDLLKKFRPETDKPAADPFSALDHAVNLLAKLQPPVSVPAAVTAKNPVEEVGAMIDLVNKLKENFAPAAAAPGDGGNLASVAAIVHEVATVLKEPVALAMRVWANSKTPPAGTPGAPPPPAPPPAATGQPTATARPTPGDQPPPPPEGVIGLASAITPVMLKWIHTDAPGEELGAGFAAWVFDGWGLQDLKSLQDVGSAGIMGLYQNSPVWIVLAPMASKFAQFVDSFVHWQPDDDELESRAGEVADLDSET